MDKPIGIYLLLWPTLWALWIAAKGVPSPGILLIFVFGVMLTRAAGCVINDFADRKVDGPSNVPNNGRWSAAKSAAKSLGVFCAAHGHQLPAGAVHQRHHRMAVIRRPGLAASYPFMKRYTYYPQVVLGAAFSWGMPMAFTAEPTACRRRGCCTSPTCCGPWPTTPTTP
jgi:4-hydroxybenzoate polyprenyltransferase